MIISLGEMIRLSIAWQNILLDLNRRETNEFHGDLSLPEVAVVNPFAAGIDVGSRSQFVAVWQDPKKTCQRIWCLFSRF